MSVSSVVQRSRVLVIDDDVVNLELLTDLLRNQFDVRTAVDGDAGVQAASEFKPDAVLLDIAMPKLDGLSVCETLRRDPGMQFVPIIMVSGRNTEQQRVESFLKGADDFVAKPFATSELLVRLNTKLKRAKETKSLISEGVEIKRGNLMRCGNLTLDLDRLEVRVNEQIVSVSLLEFELLKFFVVNREKVLSRQYILEAVWADAVVIDRTVDTHISGLRKKLAGCDYTLKTIYGAGYILKPV